jgi:arylsulfatase A
MRKTITLFVTAFLIIASTTFAQSPPNVVIMLADDLGYGDLSSFGHPIIKTPNLDRLASEGMKLTDCYAAAPVCSPSRAGMLTGRTPNRVGIYDWIPQGSPMHVRAEEVTIAELLRTRGYDTCISGKYHCNGVFNDRRQPQPGDQGFDHWFCTQNNAGPTHKNPRNFVRNGKAAGPLEGYSSTIIVEEAITWLRGRQDSARPFLLLVWFHSPHEIVATAESFREMYAGKGTADQIEYYGNVTQMDHEAGRLLSYLDEAKLRDNTLVMFSSDNGPETLDRYPTANHSHGSPGPLRGMKLHLYEGGLRVPGILRFPGRIKPGQTSREPVSFVDVLPTLCALSGAPLPNDRTLDGTSWLPLFEGKPLNRTKPLYWQYDKSISAPKVAVRKGDWKLLAATNADGRPADFELYDLSADVAEKTDLAPSNLGKLDELKSDLLKLFDEVKKEGPIWQVAANAPQRD